MSSIESGPEENIQIPYNKNRLAMTNILLNIPTHFRNILQHILTAAHVYKSGSEGIRGFVTGLLTMMFASSIILTNSQVELGFLSSVPGQIVFATVTKSSQDTKSLKLFVFNIEPRIQDSFNLPMSTLDNLNHMLDQYNLCHLVAADILDHICLNDIYLSDGFTEQPVEVDCEPETEMQLFPDLPFEHDFVSITNEKFSSSLEQFATKPIIAKELEINLENFGKHYFESAMKHLVALQPKSTKNYNTKPNYICRFLEGGLFNWMHQINVQTFSRFSLIDPRQICDLNILIQDSDQGYFLDAQTFPTTFVVDHSGSTELSYPYMELDHVETEVEPFNLNRDGPLEPPAEYQTENQRLIFIELKLNLNDLKNRLRFRVSNLILNRELLY